MLNMYIWNIIIHYLVSTQVVIGKFLIIKNIDGEYSLEEKDYWQKDTTTEKYTSFIIPLT